MEDRLVSVTRDGVLLAEYLYDPFGRRLKKTLHEGGAPSVTYFAYAGEGLAAEMDESGTVHRA